MGDDNENSQLPHASFAVQTRRQELADELVALPEDQLRLLRRAQMNMYNLQLAQAAQNAGVIEPIDFAIFTDHGYKGLCGGLAAKDTHARKGLNKNQQMLDHMGSDELAANIFRIRCARRCRSSSGMTELFPLKGSYLWTR